MDPTPDFLLLCSCSRMAFVPLFLRAGKSPHRISCWWQPSNRLVALLHLPAHLHDPRFLAPLVAYFGSLVSTSYLANFKDNNVILVLVKDCTIAKIPHILPVSDGNTVIPIRTQVIFEEKVREEGIINTADHSPVNFVMQTRPADLYTSALLSEILHTNTKDKSKQTGASSVSTIDIDSDWSVQGRNTLLGVRILDQVRGFSLTPPPDPTSLVETAQGKPVLGQDSDLSAKERSQYPTSDSIAPTKSTALSPIQTSSDPAVRKEAGLVGKRNIDNIKDGNSQHIDLSN